MGDRIAAGFVLISSLKGIHARPNGRRRTLLEKKGDSEGRAGISDCRESNAS